MFEEKMMEAYLKHNKLGEHDPYYPRIVKDPSPQNLQRDPTEYPAGHDVKV